MTTGRTRWLVRLGRSSRDHHNVGLDGSARNPRLTMTTLTAMRTFKKLRIADRAELRFLPIGQGGQTSAEPDLDALPQLGDSPYLDDYPLDGRRGAAVS